VRTIVRFRTSRGEFALPVEQVKEVRRAGELALLPAAQADVAGVITRGDDVLPVLSVLGTDGDHVIVVEVEGVRFGLLVDEVTGVRRVEDSDVGPPPRGQEGAGVSASIVEGAGVVLVLDPLALRRRLGP
jgi:purine-binding chemotaxis protein CheW